jgi:glutathione synthase/RimK-type ligase-like ATP-grasp enzyme
MRILILGDPQNEAVVRRHWPDGHDIDVLPLTGLFAGWDGERLFVIRSDSLRPLTDYDAVWLLGWGTYSSMARLVAFYLVQNGVPSLNTELFDTWPVTKVAELCRLTAAGIAHPKTVCTQLSENIPRLATWAQAALGFELPVIVKAVGGARGETNFRVLPGGELVLPDRWRMYLIQEFIPNDGDWRIVVINGRAVTAIRRKRADDSTHLNNTSAGGTATVVDLDAVDPTVLDLAVRAARVMGRSQLGGVDLVTHAGTGRHYVLEVNLCPDLVRGAADESDVAVKLRATFDALEQGVRLRRGA